MARFEARLRMYLEAVASRSAPERSRLRALDGDALRRHVLARLREFASDPDRDPAEVRRRHGEWSERLPRLVDDLERLPIEDSTSADSLALRLIDLDFIATNAESVDDLEARRLLGELWSTIEQPRYALECGFTRRRGDQTVLTAVGRTYLQLRGKDALRWLLTTETLQNTGPGDVWRMPTRLLIDAMPPIGLDLVDLSHGYLPYTRDAVWRAAALDLLTLDDPVAGDACYVVVPAMREVVQAVIEPGPWHAAIRAMLDDERAAILPGLVGTTSAVDATIEQTRLITHEVRNALVPVRGNLDAAMASIPAPTRERIERARVGVVRVLTFVDQLVATAELIGEPSTRCELGAISREAVDHVDAADRVSFVEPPAALTLQAPRSRLVMTLGNVIRNALQAAPAPTPVRVAWLAEPGGVRIVVDDGGPGVPRADRARIFDDGFTTRPGGSGFGLAFARRFVEGTLRGTIRCEDSDLGGARFVITVPAEPTS